MNRRTSLLIAGVGLLGVLMVAGTALAADAAVTITESNDRYAFSPATVHVNVGDSVTWTNDSDAPHNVTSDSGDELTSENFEEGATFDHAFGATGTFAYHCTIHSYMTGSVVVLAAGVTAPPTETASDATADDPNGIGLALLLLGVLAVSGLALRRYRPTS